MWAMTCICLSVILGLFPLRDELIWVLGTAMWSKKGSLHTSKQLRSGNPSGINWHFNAWTPGQAEVYGGTPWKRGSNRIEFLSRSEMNRSCNRYECQGMEVSKCAENMWFGSWQSPKIDQLWLKRWEQPGPTTCGSWRSWASSNGGMRSCAATALQDGLRMLEVKFFIIFASCKPLVSRGCRSVRAISAKFLLLLLWAVLPSCYGLLPTLVYAQQTRCSLCFVRIVEKHFWMSRSWPWQHLAMQQLPLPGYTQHCLGLQRAQFPSGCLAKPQVWWAWKEPTVIEKMPRTKQPSTILTSLLVLLL